MNCPLCLSSHAATFATWPEFSVEQCRFCGFRFVDTSKCGYPRDAQFRFEGPEIGPIRPQLPHIQRRVTDALHFKMPPGRALDIGCGKGEVSLALAEKGFECTGMDMNPRFISHLREHFSHVAWRCGSTADLARMAERFDLLTLYHVLEHVPDPKGVLIETRALANPGALIVIEVPNVGGWEARLRGRRWHYYKVDHLGYFRVRDLLALAKDLELTVLRVRGYQHFSHPQNVLWKDWVKGALAWLGFQDVISIFLRVP